MKQMAAIGGTAGSTLILDDPATAGAPADGPTAALTSVTIANDVIVKIHPLVLFSVLDHYLRRSDGQTRVIGTLLGAVTGGVVEVTNSFAVPHQENANEVAVGKDFNKQMVLLQQRVSSRERVVGWYATSYEGANVVDHSSLIHEFYTAECEAPIHLVVDTALRGNVVGCRAYVSTPLEIGGVGLANVFHQVRVKLDTTEAERISIDRMAKGQEAPFQSSEGVAVVHSQMANLEASMHRLLDMLQQASDYVDKVVSGEVEADLQIGRKIADTLAVVPRMRPEVFAQVFDNSLQDLLMVSYLSSLTRAQLSIAEKLSV